MGAWQLAPAAMRGLGAARRRPKSVRRRVQPHILTGHLTTPPRSHNLTPNEQLHPSLLLFARRKTPPSSLMSSRSGGGRLQGLTSLLRRRRGGAAPDSEDGSTTPHRWAHDAAAARRAAGAYATSCCSPGCLELSTHTRPSGCPRMKPSAITDPRHCCLAAACLGCRLPVPPACTA